MHKPECLSNFFYLLSMVINKLFSLTMLLIVLFIAIKASSTDLKRQKSFVALMVDD